MADCDNDIEAAPNESPVVPREEQAAAATALSSASQTREVTTLSVLDQTLTVTKRKLKTGSVRVSTRTETHEELAEFALERGAVDVTRVPVDRIVDEAPPVRTEGGITIVPVLEERFVLVKRLILVEEVHIRRRIKHETRRVPVILRRQHADVLRFGPDGQPVPDGLA